MKRLIDSKQQAINNICYVIMLCMCEDIIRENNLRCTSEFLASIDTFDIRKKWHEFEMVN
uniref:Uncharacterized protein n=1 Tax=viral metagenome TaxID=1070528 RepID=A0A6M3LVH8_9ZZZZ